MDRADRHRLTYEHMTWAEIGAVRQAIKLSLTKPAQHLNADASARCDIVHCSMNIALAKESLQSGNLGERKALLPDAAYLRLTSRRMGRHGPGTGKRKLDEPVLTGTNHVIPFKQPGPAT